MKDHYEPAVVWSLVVRHLPCARAIFTATPREDFKTFDIDPNHTYRYSFDQARRERYICDAKLYKYSPAAFADQSKPMITCSPRQMRTTRIDQAK